MKSVPYSNLGNNNLRGKKSKAIKAGKYVEDVIYNYKESELEKEDRKEILRALGFSRISSNNNKF